MRRLAEFLMPFIILSLVLIGCDKKSDDIPTSPVTLQSLIDEGFRYYQEGEYSEAITRFQEALERDVDPDNSLRAYQGLGWTYARIERYASSVNNFSFLLSAEALESGKYPIVEGEDILTHSDPVPVEPSFSDTAGQGRWTLQTVGSEFILSLDEVFSYSAEAEDKNIQEGASSGTIEPGASKFVLSHAPVSNPAGDGVGTPLSSSLEFGVADNMEKDSLTTPVASPEEITEYDEYYLEPEKGEVTIKPRYWPIVGLDATYKYATTYPVRNHGWQSVSLKNTLEDGSSFPVLNPNEYQGDAAFYLTGEFFNRTDGGTYYQADAHAGMAAAYSSQGDYISAVRSARTAILINDYLQSEDPDHYPYQRQLFEEDTEYGLWQIYMILADAYVNLEDYLHAEECIEDFLGAGDVLNPANPEYEYNLVKKLATIERPENWSPPVVPGW